jgi:hypothetical protein
MTAIPHPDCAACEHVFAVGDRVFLRGARFGAAGRVLRRERGKIAVYWPDLDFISRHRPESLMEAPRERAEQGHLEVTELS